MKRAAFIYLEPKAEKNRDKFAQCKTCMMWTGEKGQTCTIHGKDVVVTGDMSCVFYVEGDPMPEMAGEEHPSVNVSESDLYKGNVRCENCEYGDASRYVCTLFEQLNEKMDTHLNTKIDPKGCCNAFHPAKKSIKRLKEKYEEAED
jgi:hypothetical protein